MDLVVYLKSLCLSSISSVIMVQETKLLYLGLNIISAQMNHVLSLSETQKILKTNLTLIVI